jgi:hypothetical protein
VNFLAVDCLTGKDYRKGAQTEGPTANLRNGIVQVFQNMFQDKEIAVREKVVDPFMLARLVEMRNAHMMTMVLDLAQKFKTRWQFF